MWETHADLSYNSWRQNSPVKYWTTMIYTFSIACSWFTLLLVLEPHSVFQALAPNFVQIYVTLFPSFTYTYYPTLDLKTHYFKHLWKNKLVSFSLSLYPIYLAISPLGFCPYLFSLLHYPGNQVIHLNAFFLLPPTTGEETQYSSYCPLLKLNITYSSSYCPISPLFLTSKIKS